MNHDAAPGVPVVGQLGAFQMLPADAVAIGVGAGWAPTLCLWIGPAMGNASERDQFWVEWSIGSGALWIRFDRKAQVMGRALFEAAEALPALGPSRPPQDAWWLLAEPQIQKP